jgi:hypothetical protein
VVRWAKTAAAGSYKGYEHEVRDAVGNLFSIINIFTTDSRYMYDFHNDKPLVAGVWQKAANAPSWVLLKLLSWCLQCCNSTCT